MVSQAAVIGKCARPTHPVQLAPCQSRRLNLGWPGRMGHPMIFRVGRALTIADSCQGVRTTCEGVYARVHQMEWKEYD